MNFLSLLFLTILALGVATTIPSTSISEKSTSDIVQKIIADNQAQPNSQDEIGEKKVTKRSYGWSPWNYYNYGWPWYAIGWYPGWPYYGHGFGYGGYGHGYGGYGGYGGYIGYRGYGGWYKGW
ncbi:shematrin-like protein 1 [Apis dorsata]|uniref:shematrin-like protein 1 n=1 Tax=Apis dorsata TaxID=7462 RepID=UPI0003DF4B70|nr:shematrin-like protein 1 [Apis dorsata]